MVNDPSPLIGDTVVVSCVVALVGAAVLAYIIDVILFVRGKRK